MKKLLSIILFSYSLNAFSILLPNPKFTIDAKEEKEAQESPAKLRAAAIRMIVSYYDAYVLELKRINNSDIDPNLKQPLIVAGQTASAELLRVPPLVVLKGVRGMLNEVLLNPVVDENGLKTALTNLLDSSARLQQKSLELESETNSLVSYSQIQGMLKSLAPSNNQKFANIILGELFLIIVLLALRRRG